MDDHRAARAGESDGRQRDWAQLFLDLHLLTAVHPARDFIECLADVATLHGEHGTGDAAERAEWRELGGRLQAQLDHHSLYPDAENPRIEKA